MLVARLSFYFGQTPLEYAPLSPDSKYAPPFASFDFVTYGVVQFASASSPSEAMPVRELVADHSPLEGQKQEIYGNSNNYWCQVVFRRWNSAYSLVLES